MFNKLKRRQGSSHRHILGFSLLVLAIISGIFPVNILAQNNPFGVPPAAQPGVTPPGQPPLNADTPLNGENNIIIRQLLIENPNTPIELANAIRLCVQLGRTDVARRFIESFQTLMPSPEECSDIQRSLNSGFLYEIAIDKRLQPEGGIFVKTIRDGAIAYLRDDTRIAKLINELGDEDEFVRRRATTELRTCDVNAAVALGTALGDPARKDYYDNIKIALAGMGNIAVEPTIGFLGVKDEQHKARIIAVLGKLRAIRIADRIVTFTIIEPADSPVGAAARQAITEIVGVLPTKAEAVQYLKQQFGRYLKGDLMLPQDSEGRLILWAYDADQKTVIPERRDARIISLAYATLASRDLYRLDLGNPEYKQLFLRSVLQSSKVLNGVNQPLADGTKALLSQESAEYVLSLLEHCLETKHYPAAVGAAEVLGDIGDESLLYSTTGKATRLIEALNNPSRRVRFAIANAIFKMDPKRPFPGSSYVTTAAAYFVQTGGTRKAVAADIKSDRGLKWAGLLSQIGLIGDRAISGDNLINLAQKNPDYEFILLSEAIQNPGLNDTVYKLRNDPRTAEIPIGIIIDNIPNLDIEFARVVQNSVTGKDEDGFFKNPVLHRAEIATNPAYKLRSIKHRLGTLEEQLSADEKPLPSVEGRRERSRAQRLADVDPLTFALFEPNTADQMLFQTKVLRQTATYQSISVEERVEQARTCLDWFAKILANQPVYGFYNPIRHQEPMVGALFFPRLCAPATEVLKHLPTPEAQKALLTIASQNTAVLENRKLAAAAFSQHVSSYRILLTRDEITEQYNLYNKSIVGAQDELDILGGLLDSIEDRENPADSSGE